MPKITFIGEPDIIRRGFKQRHFCPLWPQGLGPGDSVDLPEVPHDRIHGLPQQFLVDGQPYKPPAPEKPKAVTKKDKS